MKAKSETESEIKSLSIPKDWCVIKSKSVNQIMRVSIHQPLYMPWGGFFQKMALTDVMIIFDKAKFTKSDFMQRNKIRTPDGWRYITIPISKEFHDKPINEVRITDRDFRRIHIEAIHQNYHKAPYYESYAESLRKLINSNAAALSDFNLATISFLAQEMGLNCRLVLSSSLDIDWSRKGSDINLALLQAAGADYYFSGATGKGYLKLEDFEKSGIRVEFQSFIQKEYPQVFPGFVPGLSVVDALLNVGDKTINYI